MLMFNFTCSWILQFDSIHVFLLELNRHNILNLYFMCNILWEFIVIGTRNRHKIILEVEEGYL